MPLLNAWESIGVELRLTEYIEILEQESSPMNRGRIIPTEDRRSAWIPIGSHTITSSGKLFL